MTAVDLNLTALAQSINECAQEDDREKRIKMATTILILLKLDLLDKTKEVPA